MTDQCSLGVGCYESGICYAVAQGRPEMCGLPRKGDWIQTFTGKRFYVLDPRPADVDIRDIGHALSLQCRYGGHARFFYSVAEHCVILAMWVWATTKNAKLAFAALMHDAAETYLPDLARPTKHHMPEYTAVEARLESVIFPIFSVGQVELDLIKEFDTRILMDERKVLFDVPLKWGTDNEPLGVRIFGWHPSMAEREFATMFNILRNAA